MLSIIVAKAKNNIIGKNNKLLWSLPEDLKRFKKLTTGHTIIMGRKTFDSLGRVLPNRKHIVFTQNPDFKVEDENVEIVHSMLEIKQYIDDELDRYIKEANANTIGYLNGDEEEPVKKETKKTTTKKTTSSKKGSGTTKAKTSTASKKTTSTKKTTKTPTKSETKKSTTKTTKKKVK